MRSEFQSGETIWALWTPGKGSRKRSQPQGSEIWGEVSALLLLAVTPTDLFTFVKAVFSSMRWRKTLGTTTLFVNIS